MSAAFVRTYTFVFAFVHVGILIYVTAFPFFNLPFYNELNFVWWALLFWIACNLFLPIILSAAIVGYENPSRIDFHSIFTVLTILVNIIAGIILTFVYAAFINTSFSGKFPFNDPKYCCVYFNRYPEICTNTVPCNPNVTNSMLSPTGGFYMLWIFSLVFFIVSLLHLGINRLLRVSGGVVSEEGKRHEGRVLGIFAAFIYAGVFCYWAAFPLLDTVFTHGYPLFAIPPSPGPYYSDVGNYQWWFLWLLSTNLIPPIVFVMVITLKKSKFTTLAHYWLSVLVSILSSITFIVFLGILVFDCNYNWSAGSICNSARWCCQFFANAPNFCPNVTPCQGSRIPDAAFLQNLVLSLVFSLLSLGQVWINFRMQKYSVFH